MALCLLLPTRVVAQAQISQSGAPRLAGISGGTSFKALRENLPKANWHISESDKPYSSDGVHERRMFATNAVNWQGHNFDIYLLRGRFNNSTFIGVTNLNQSSEVDCQKRSFTILDEFSKLNGFLADQWKPDHPRFPYQGTRVWWEIEQFRLLGLEPSPNIFVQDAGEGGATVRIAKTNEGIVIGFPEDSSLNFRRDIGWRSYYDNGQYLVGFVTVFGKFDFGLPEKVPSQCKVTIKISHKGDYSLSNSTSFVNITDRDSIELVGSRGATYGAIMDYDDFGIIADDSELNFECDIRAIPSRTTKISGQFDNCKPLDDLSPFCGRMRVEPKENTAAFASIWRKFQRGIVCVRIDPKLDDGTSSVGKFFFRRLVFRLPDSEMATDPAADR
jgi:hypothetical protein